MVIQIAISIFLICACWAMVSLTRTLCRAIGSLSVASLPREAKLLVSSLSEMTCARAAAMRTETARRKQSDEVVNVGQASKSMFTESVDGVGVEEIRLPEYPSGDDPSAGMTFSHDMSELIGD